MRSEPRDPKARSEFLLERADFEFHRPCTRILVYEMPVGLCNRLGLEKVAVLQTRLQSTRTGDIDTAVDVDPHDVDASSDQDRAASDCAKPRIANFAGPKETDFGPAFTPAVAPVNSIEPCPRAIIAGAASLAATNAPKALTRQSASY